MKEIVNIGKKFLHSWEFENKELVKISRKWASAYRSKKYSRKSRKCEHKNALICVLLKFFRIKQFKLFVN